MRGRRYVRGGDLRDFGYGINDYREFAAELFDFVFGERNSSQFCEVRYLFGVERM